MKWLRFSLRTMLLLVALAALGSLGLRLYLDRSYARVERAMDAMWRDSPTAGIAFDPTHGVIVAVGVGKLSPETAHAICDAELIKGAVIDCGSREPGIPGMPEIDVPRPVAQYRGGPVESPTLSALQAGFESVGWHPPSNFGAGTAGLNLESVYDPEKKVLRAGVFAADKFSKNPDGP